MSNAKHSTHSVCKTTSVNIYQLLIHTLIILSLSIMATVALERPVGDPHISYDFVEELPANSRIGELMNDYGLKEKYNASVLDTLRFSILMQPNFDRAYVAIEETTGIIRSTHKVCITTFQVSDIIYLFSWIMSNAQYTNVNNFKSVKQTHDDNHNTKHDGSWFIRAEKQFIVNELFITGCMAGN